MFKLWIAYPVEFLSIHVYHDIGIVQLGDLGNNLNLDFFIHFPKFYLIHVWILIHKIARLLEIFKDLHLWFNNPEVLDNRYIRLDSITYLSQNSLLYAYIPQLIMNFIFFASIIPLKNLSSFSLYHPWLWPSFERLRN